MALASASYNAANFTVILTPRKRLVLNPPIRLTVVAASLLDAEDRPLDAGVNIVAVLSPSGARIRVRFFDPGGSLGSNSSFGPALLSRARSTDGPANDRLGLQRAVSPAEIRPTRRPSYPAAP